MDSLPEQHIDHLPGATRRAAYEMLRILYNGRVDRLSEQQIAEKVGFTSPEMMHRQLEIWGLPGLVPPKVAPPEEPGGQTAAGDEPKARSGGGKAEELPAAAGATDIFWATISGLVEDLEYVQAHREILQDNSFVQTATSPGDDLLLRGRTPYPSRRLVRLITAALMKASSQAEVEQLLSALHPKPEKADRKEITKLATGWVGVGKQAKHRDDALKPIARKLAKLIRGGVNTPGRKARLNQYEHLIINTMQQARRRGDSEDVIRRAVMPKVEDMWEVQRLGKNPDAEFTRLSKISLAE